MGSETSGMPQVRRMVQCNACQYVGAWSEMVDGDFPEIGEDPSGVDLDAIQFTFLCPRCGTNEGPLGVQDGPEEFGVHGVLTGGLSADEMAAKMRGTSGRDTLILEIFTQLNQSERYREFVALNYEVEHRVDDETKTVSIFVHEKPFPTLTTMGEIAEVLDVGGRVCMSPTCGVDVVGDVVQCPACNGSAFWDKNSLNVAPAPGTVEATDEAAAPRKAVALDPSGFPIDTSPHGAPRSPLEKLELQRPGSMDPKLKAKVESILKGRGNPDKIGS